MLFSLFYIDIVYGPLNENVVIIHICICGVHYSTRIGKIACPTCTCPPTPLLAGLIPTVMLLLANVVTGVVVFLITRHCYKKTSQKSSSKDEDVYEQVEGPKTYEDIVLTDSPAYGPMK